jgi:hypothetical protein
MPVILTPIGSPSASDVSLETRLDVIQLRHAVLYDNQLKQKVRGGLLRQGVAGIVQLDLVNSQGQAVDLRTYGFTDGLEFSSSLSTSASQTTGTISLAAKIREASEVQRCSNHDADVVVYAAAAGLVRVILPEIVYAVPGIYRLEVALLDAQDTPVFIYPSYLYVERSGWNSGGCALGPPLVDTVRLLLRDSDIYENMLIDDHDFPLAELSMAAVRAVQFWNQQPPIMARAVFTTMNFPFEQTWLEGIQLYLFQLAEEHYRRNKLQYGAGGTSTNDKNRDAEYKKAWQERYQEFTRLVRHQKAQINVNGGWGSLRSR